MTEEQNQPSEVENRLKSEGRLHEGVKRRGWPELIWAHQAAKCRDGQKIWKDLEAVSGGAGLDLASLRIQRNRCPLKEDVSAETWVREAGLLPER